MTKKILWYSIFFIILTGAFFYFVFAGTDNYKFKSPTVSYVKPFSFINQDGRTITEQDLQGKVTVVEYFFTTCKGICPRMHSSMSKIYDKFKEEPAFQVLAHTVQPEIDSIPRLRYYADSMKIDTKKWNLVTGRKDSLYNAARVSYLLDDPKNSVEKLEDQFIHTQFFALVDKSGNVRGGVFDALKADEMQKLSTTIEELLKEKQGPSSFVNGIFGNSPR
ncbi:SCO family protein [Aridibaculum aurantiacum]|uniref:SCO family protein n=1 Tax=Aridibaculum aurantiacum TaxID=2810307 RepID=UPI001A969E9E|nr:SCO family protein [Aridibaculum aurantiacum]